MKKLIILIIGVCLTMMLTTACMLLYPAETSDDMSEVKIVEKNDKVENEDKAVEDKNDINNAKPKHFKVDGTKILTPEGKEFLIKGVNVNGPGWVFERDTLQDVELIVDVWQFNTVRLCAAIGWEWAVNNNSDLDGIIKAFTERNIVVMLEVHDYTGIYPPQDDEGYRSENVKYVYPVKVLKEWWVDKANRFKDNPYVWFNIMNEPGSDNSENSADLWAEIHSEVIEAIRDTGAENIIVLDEHGWGQGSGYHGGKNSFDSAIIRRGPALNKKYDNLVYSLHVYDAWRDGKSRFDDYFRDAKELDLCVILGEFGVGKDNLGQHNAVKAMYNSAIPNNIGRMYWAWDDGGLPASDSGGFWAIDKTDGAMPGNLTWAGEMVWLDTHGLLDAPVPDYSLVLPLLPNGDFEDGMTGWQDWGGCSVQDGESYNGSKALVLTSESGGGAGRPLELKPDTKYSFSAWGKADKKTASVIDVGVKYRAADDMENEQHYFVSFSKTEWEQKSMTFTTPDEFSGETLFIWTNAQNAEFYLDDFELAEVID